MKLPVKNLWLAIFLCLSAVGANSATHYLVPANAGASGPYTSWETAGTSVYDVIRVARTNGSEPRVVWMTNGTYVLTNAILLDTAMAVRGVNGRDATLIDGNGMFRIQMTHIGAVLDGVTVTNGAGSSGGGIYLTKGLVTNCLITACKSTGSGANRGGGIFIGSTSVVANTIIRGNRMLAGDGNGGGVAVHDGANCLIENCIIEYNQCASAHGGGVGLGYSGPFNATVRNCLIRYNSSANYAGGIWISNTTNWNTRIINCTIVSNTAVSSGGAGITFLGNATLSNTILNCVIVSNMGSSFSANRNINDIGAPAAKYAVAYSCSTSNNNFILDSRGNTTNDPQFTSFAEGDYRFDRFSPCYNSGTNQTGWMSGATDLDGRPRILHGVVDMGAYELFIPGGTMFKIR